MNGEGNYSEPDEPGFNQFPNPAIYADAYAGGEAEVLGNDDPAAPIVDGFNDFRFTQINVRGGSGSGMAISIMGPWLPKNFVHPNAAMASRLNPFDNYRNPEANVCPPDSPGCSGFYAPTPESMSLKNLGNLKFEAQYPKWATNQDGDVIPCGPPDDCGDYEYNPNGAPVTSAVQQAANFNSQLTGNITLQTRVVNYFTYLGGRNPPEGQEKTDFGICGEPGGACDGQGRSADSGSDGPTHGGCGKRSSRTAFGVCRTLCRWQGLSADPDRRCRAKVPSGWPRPGHLLPESRARPGTGCREDQLLPV